MKFIARLVLIIVAMQIMPQISIYAQFKPNGSYVATKVTYLSGDELPDDNILKHSYVKYTFSPQDRINISTSYDELGTPFLFEIRENILFVKSETGSIINTLKILENTNNKLVLISSAARGELDDPWAIKYTLHKEEFIQKQMKLSPDDIFSINGIDTIYKSGQKIYAQFKTQSFQRYVYDHIGINMSGKNEELHATFIVDENGRPDSLKILQGISPKFDAAYIKAFNSAKKMWQPAYHNGRNVKVQMKMFLKYRSSEQTLPPYFDSRKANAAFNKQNYELALFYYDKALEIDSSDAENLYHRGICKQQLGNVKGACADWQKIQSLGKNLADELLLKYCKQ